MKKRKNNAYLIFPLLAIEFNENYRFSITFGWWSITFSINIK